MRQIQSAGKKLDAQSQGILRSSSRVRTSVRLVTCCGGYLCDTIRHCRKYLIRKAPFVARNAAPIAESRRRLSLTLRQLRATHLKTHPLNLLTICVLEREHMLARYREPQRITRHGFAI